MIILLIAVVAGLILAAAVRLVVLYNHLLLAWRTVTDLRQKILENFISLFQKTAVFCDDYAHHLRQESRQELNRAAAELKDWLGKAIKELSQQWDWKMVEVVDKKLSLFLAQTAAAEGFPGDKNLEFIKKNAQSLERMFGGYRRLIDSYNERARKYPGNFLVKLKDLPREMEK
jgi:hypothetical protein